MTWAAIIGTVVSVGVSAGSAAIAANNAPGGYVPPLVKPDPIDLNQLDQGAKDTATLGYQLSDADRAARFPGLVSGNKDAIDSAYKNLTGPLDPTVQNSFATKGLIGALGATGGGNAAAGIGGAGSATSNEIARSVGTDVLSKEDYDRSVVDQLVADNPERTFGITGSQAVNLKGYDNQQQNDYNWQKYTNRLQSDASGGGGGA